VRWSANEYTVNIEASIGILNKIKENFLRANRNYSRKKGSGKNDAGYVSDALDARQ